MYHNVRDYHSFALAIRLVVSSWLTESGHHVPEVTGLENSSAVRRRMALREPEKRTQNFSQVYLVYSTTEPYYSNISFRKPFLHEGCKWNYSA